MGFLMNKYVYRDHGEDVDNAGLLIPRYKALGRTAPNGTVYPERELKADESDLVAVRSIVTKTKGNLFDITPDLIGKKFKEYTDGAAIGISFGTSLTENITQSTLGLKHGGHERVLFQEGILRAPEDCELQEDGSFLILKTRNRELKYPRPSNFVGTGKTTFKKGEIVGTAYNTTSPIYRTNALVDLFKANKSNGKRFYEKDNVIFSECYAVKPGKISYQERAGRMEVWIGSELYAYSSDCMYYWPEGTEIKKYQRICSGVVNMPVYTRRFGKDINSTYLIFRSQFYTLNDPGYAKTGVTTLSSMQEEIIELLFASLVNVNINDEGTSIEDVAYEGSARKISGKESFFTNLSYGYASKVIGKAMKGEANMENDLMASTVLGLLLNNELDKKD